ncbi:MAG: hypothetical protein RLZZ283_242 [Candidatus Parcubacteria bacterium]|jgi:erythromycin esterase-like protein
MTEVRGSNESGEEAQIFQEAIDSFDVKEANFDFGKNASPLREGIQSTGLLLLGEIHGVAENANVIYTLFKKFGFRTLALEWPKSMQGAVDSFLETGKLDFSAIQGSADGRVTAGHFAVMRKLKQEGILHRVVCIDDGDMSNWNDRDENMAKNVAAVLPDGPVLVVAGNLHTRTSSIDIDGQTHHPMGEHIRKRVPNAPVATLDYLSGEYENSGRQYFKKRSPNVPTRGSVRQSHPNEYIIEIPKASGAIVPSPVSG